MLNLLAESYDLSKYMYQAVENEFTIVHLAASFGCFKVVLYFIDKHGFNLDYYNPPLHRLTLLHVVAKFHLNRFSDEEKKDISELIKRSNNLLLKNNFGKTIVTLAKSMNNYNEEFLKTEIEAAIGEKIRGLAFVIDSVLRKQKTTINKYILRDIYKYLDG